METLAARFDAPLCLLARLLMATLFLMGGMDIGMNMQGFSARLVADGLPALTTGFVFWFLLITALGLALGIRARAIALVMAGFSLASGLIDYADFRQPTDMVMLLKNIALTGGYLFAALHGPGAWSIDAAMATHRARRTA